MSDNVSHRQVDQLPAQLQDVTSRRPALGYVGWFVVHPEVDAGYRLRIRRRTAACSTAWPGMLVGVHPRANQRLGHHGGHRRRVGELAVPSGCGFIHISTRTPIDLPPALNGQLTRDFRRPPRASGRSPGTPAAGSSGPITTGRLERTAWWSRCRRSAAPRPELVDDPLWVAGHRHHSRARPSARSRPRFSAWAPASLSTWRTTASPICAGVIAADSSWASRASACSRSRSRRSA